MKNFSFSKNKFFLCFRPVVDIDAMLESKVVGAAHRASASVRFPCIKKGTSENKPVFFHKGSQKFSESWIMQHPPKRTISKVIKAVVFETILNRRAHHKKGYGYGCFGSSKHNYSTYKETKAPQSSLSTLSSNGSSCSIPKASQSNLNLSKEKQKEGSHGGKQLEKQKKFECYGICLVLLICLAFTVFWGKLFGIVLTPMWFYFSSLWDSSYRCQKMLLTCPRQRIPQCKDKGHYYYGRRYARSELLHHNGH